MKKLILSSVLTGIGYGLMLFGFIAIFQGASVPTWSFVFGATLGVSLRIFRIPEHVCRFKAGSKRYWLSISLVTAAGCLAVLPLRLAWPSVSFDDLSFGWALLGCSLSAAAIAVIVALVQRRKPAKPI